VLVCRNRQWFKDNISLLQEIWTTIEKERISGYEHRAPNRKSKKELIEPIKTPSSGCLLRFHKETGKINVIKKETDNVDILVSELKNMDINI
jgi:hypothetical protein